MQYITDIQSYQGKKRTAVTLGKFDGMHRGHQKLLAKIKEHADENCESVVFTFEMCIRDSIKSETQAIESGELPEDYMEQMGLMGEEGYTGDYEDYEEEYDETYEDAAEDEEYEFIETDDGEA